MKCVECVSALFTIFSRSEAREPNESHSWLCKSNPILLEILYHADVVVFSSVHLGRTCVWENLECLCGEKERRDSTPEPEK